MTKKGVPMPEDAPKKGEVYRHYKGDSYRVVDLALHSNDDEWIKSKLLCFLSVLRADATLCVAGERWAGVYEPMYKNPNAHLFTRPVREWNKIVEWQGQKKPRFEKQ